MSTDTKRIILDYDLLFVDDLREKSARIAEILQISKCKEEEFVNCLLKLFETAYGFQKFSKVIITYELYCYSIQRVMGPLKRFGITVKKLQEAICYYDKVYAKIDPNAEQLLNYLKRKGYKICAIVHGFAMYYEDNIKYRGFYKYFEKVYTWDNNYIVSNKKSFIRLLSGTEPEQNIILGCDLERIILPAKELGLYTILIERNDPEKANYIMSIL